MVVRKFRRCRAVRLTSCNARSFTLFSGGNAPTDLDAIGSCRKSSHFLMNCSTRENLSRPGKVDGWQSDRLKNRESSYRLFEAQFRCFLTWDVLKKVSALFFTPLSNPGDEKTVAKVPEIAREAASLLDREPSAIFFCLSSEREQFERRGSRVFRAETIPKGILNPFFHRFSSSRQPRAFLKEENRCSSPGESPIRDRKWLCIQGYSNQVNS